MQTCSRCHTSDNPDTAKSCYKCGASPLRPYRKRYAALLHPEIMALASRSLPTRRTGGILVVTLLLIFAFLLILLSFLLVPPPKMGTMTVVLPSTLHVTGTTPPPHVTGISPSSGVSTGGTPVTITGTGFSGATKVSFGQMVARFAVNSDRQISAVSPAGSGAVDVVVRTAAGTSTRGAADVFTYTPSTSHVTGTTPPPDITGISPSSGVSTGGTPVTITGTGFSGATGVSFGPVAAASFTVDSDRQISAVSPTGSGAVDVVVSTAAGTSTRGAADVFTYTPSTSHVTGTTPPPDITGISPSSGVSTGGTPVTITGTGFSGATMVSFGQVAAAGFTVDSDRQISAVSPAGSGAVDVVVSTAADTSTTGPADVFTYTPPPPDITGISPSGGGALGGTTVTITGTGFSGATMVSFGQVAAAGFTVNNDTQITAVSPSSRIGPVDVVVSTAAGTSTTGPADVFTYYGLTIIGVKPQAPPNVTGISPPSGDGLGGTPVTITGTGFSGATMVSFGQVAARRFTVNSNTQITAVSPGGSNTVDITVTTPGGTSVVSSADAFTYINPH